MKRNRDGEHQDHSIEPVYNQESKILILGSFPSVKSREAGFFYGHPQNRFWKVLSALCGGNLPVTTEEKEQFLLKHGIAVWDVIASCTIVGSSDSSIKDVVPNDLNRILQTADIRQIFTNGGTADKLYKKYLQSSTGIQPVKLPSTSPANAAWSLDKLVEAWKICLSFL
ncbi:MAG TPA: DNA-deoxyinosine glycosylase [Candidatus Pelethocola excrementipullorum]|nr:DNA-deoxyinosine glycosylase [Candidatus Pelethocola excrementipullorum]